MTPMAEPIIPAYISIGPDEGQELMFTDQERRTTGEIFSGKYDHLTVEEFRNLMKDGA